jgi:hypothetical protein
MGRLNVHDGYVLYCLDEYILWFQLTIVCSDIKADITKQISVEWTRKRPAPLLPYASQSIDVWMNSYTLYSEDVSFRFEGNKVLELDTSSLTLQEFYAYYSTPSMAPIYLLKVPPVWKHHLKSKTPLLCLEMYIDFDAVCPTINASA